MMPKPVVLHNVPRAAATLLRRAVPPVLIKVGAHEILAEAAAILTEVLVGHGVSVRLEIWEALTDPRQIFPDLGPKAEAATALLRRHLEKSRLKIPLLFGFGVIHGFRTIFPVPIALAASFNSDLITSSQSYGPYAERSSNICSSNDKPECIVN
jgi:hypothetical protein